MSEITGAQRFYIIRKCLDDVFSQDCSSDIRKELHEIYKTELNWADWDEEKNLEVYSRIMKHWDSILVRFIATVDWGAFLLAQKEVRKFVDDLRGSPDVHTFEQRRAL
jgi:hypothetical protein